MPKRFLVFCIVWGSCIEASLKPLWSYLGHPDLLLPVSNGTFDFHAFPKDSTVDELVQTHSGHHSYQSIEPGWYQIDTSKPVRGVLKLVFTSIEPSLYAQRSDGVRMKDIPTVIYSTNHRIRFQWFSLPEIQEVGMAKVIDGTFTYEIHSEAALVLILDLPMGGSYWIEHIRLDYNQIFNF